MPWRGIKLECRATWVAMPLLLVSQLSLTDRINLKKQTKCSEDCILVNIPFSRVKSSRVYQSPRVTTVFEVSSNSHRKFCSSEPWATTPSKHQIPRMGWRVQVQETVASSRACPSLLSNKDCR